jgi:hypothetical protein
MIIYKEEPALPQSGEHMNDKHSISLTVNDMETLSALFRARFCSRSGRRDAGGRGRLGRSSLPRVVCRGKGEGKALRD